MDHLNNQEVVIFFNKAQAKIAELGEIVADETENEVASRLLLDLSNFLESLNSPYLDWKKVDIIRYIHFWNRRANLIEIPFIQMTNYTTVINLGNGNVTDLSGLDPLIRQIISITPHNTLSSKQGGKENEFYHLTKKQIDWINCQMSKTPCPSVLQPTITFTITPNKAAFPSGYYELGSSLSTVILQGGIELNSAKSVLHHLYRKNAVEIPTTKVNTLSVNSYTDREIIKSSTVYEFEVLFEDFGIQTTQRIISFRQPMYYGVLNRNIISSLSAITLTKDVIDKQQLNLKFNLAAGNTGKLYETSQTCVVFIPASWGEPTAIMVGNFDFKPDWSFSTQSMKLADGTQEPGLLGIFNNQSEGETTFNFIF